jgi:hypothetical protein
MNTNTSTLATATFLAAIAAFALLPVNAAAAGIAVSVTGILAMLAADYGRSPRPLKVPAFAAPVRSSVALRAAA